MLPPMQPPPQPLCNSYRNLLSGVTQMSKLEGMPIQAAATAASLNYMPVGGDKFLGTDARPDVLTNLVVDDQYQKAMSSTLAVAGTGSALSIPIKTEDLRDSVIGEFTSTTRAPRSPPQPDQTHPAERPHRLSPAVSMLPCLQPRDSCGHQTIGPGHERAQHPTTGRRPSREHSSRYTGT